MSSLAKIAAVFILSIAMRSYGDTPSTVFTISGRVISRTCTFDNANQSVSLNTISVRDFLENPVPVLQEFTVTITCGSGVSSVQLSFSGSPDISDHTAFANTGQATGVALRLLHEDKVILPDGSYTAPIPVVNNTGKIILKAGYTVTSLSTFSAGDFESTAILSFIYD